MNKALELSQKIDYKKGLAKTYTFLGYFAEDKGNYPEALKNYYSSLDIREAIHDKKGIAVSYNDVARVYYFRSNYPEALKNYLASLKIFETIGDFENESTLYRNIGNIYYRQSSYFEALKYFNKSLKIRETIGNKKGIAESYNDIGNVYYNRGNYIEAIKNYFASSEIFEAINHKMGKAAAYNNLGNVYCSQGNYPQALKYFFASLKIKDEIGFKSGVAGTYTNIGIVFRKQRNRKEAVQYLIKAKELSKEIGFIENLRDIYSELTKLDSSQGNFKGAYENQKLYFLYRDSIDNEETRKKTVQTQMTYEFEKKEDATKLEQAKKDVIQNAELEKKNVQIKLYITLTGGILLLFGGVILYMRNRRKTEKVILEKQVIELEQKALSLQMNPHFIFNSINSISSFISQNDAISAKKYLAKFSKLMRLILENSRETFIPLQQEIETLSYYMELEQLRFKNKFDFQITISPDIEPAMTAIPPMLIQPQVENAILHGLMPKGGHGNITINFYLKAGKIMCEVKDDGVGRKRALEINLEQGSLHKSLAMQVTLERLDVMNTRGKEKASIGIEDLEDELKNSLGTKVTFELPLRNI